MHSYTRLLFITALISSAVSAEERLLVTKTLTSNTAQEQKKIDDLLATGNWNFEDYVQQVMKTTNAPEEQSRQSGKYF